MPKIKKFYFVNHSHTDIGFTDYQDVCFRQHMEFIDYALDMCEKTADYPKEARAKWVCEVTGMTEKYLNSCSSAQLERFLKWHKAGQIDIAGMQYNLTPLLNVEQMHRSLYPVKRMRDNFGVDINVAMNCDVDGASWIFADLLPEIGIELFTMSINPVRGAVPKPRPSAFWWEGPAGGKLLTWNGFHYLFGGLAGLGDSKLADQFVPGIVEKLENNPDYPFDFVYGPTTNPMRVDNGWPDARLYDFIREWNEAGKTPQMELITVSDLNRILRENYADQIETKRGDWTDWWSDGVASSAFETGLNRSTHEIMHSSEMIGSWLHAFGDKGWDVQRLINTYESMTLYDEHTWGAFSSIEAPDGLFSRSQWNKKSSYAYHASAEAHDILARASKKFAAGYANQEDEVRFNLGHLPPEIAKPTPTYQELMVINTLPYDRNVVVEEPVRRGGQAPNGMLEMYVPRGITWGIKPDEKGRRVQGKVPGFGYSFLPLTDAPTGDDLKCCERSIENEFYRITVDPKSGGLSEFYDKKLEYDFAGDYRGWQIGQYIYEWVDSNEGREALYRSDWANEYFGEGVKDTPFRHEISTAVQISAPVLTSYDVQIEVTIKAKGIRLATCHFILPTREKALSINWKLDKEHITDPEAVFIAFPFNLQDPQFRADINGIALTPEKEQLSGSVKDWYPVHHWVNVNDGAHGVTIAPLDAPLVQLGGITSGKWAEHLEPESSTIMSWALNNHWMVNFKASQGGQIPLRYKLTTHKGQAKDTECVKFGSQAATEPIVLRDLVRYKDAKKEGTFMMIEQPESFLITAKPAEDNNGIIIRVQNVEEQENTCRISFPEFNPLSASLVSPVEEKLRELQLVHKTIECHVAGRKVQSIRVKF